MRNEKTNGPSISAVVFGTSHGSIASPEALGSLFTEGEQGCLLGVRMAQCENGSEFALAVGTLTVRNE